MYNEQEQATIQFVYKTSCSCKFTFWMISFLYECSISIAQMYWFLFCFIQPVQYKHHDLIGNFHRYRCVRHFAKPSFVQKVCCLIIVQWIIIVSIQTILQKSRFDSVIHKVKKNKKTGQKNLWKNMNISVFSKIFYIHFVIDIDFRIEIWYSFE